MTIDWNLTADDYSTHRAGFPASLFPRLAAHGVGLAGQRLLDLGTGTGSLARGLAQQGAAVVGLDVARSMLASAQALDAQAGVATPYVAAQAEKLPFAAGAEAGRGAGDLLI